MLILKKFLWSFRCPLEAKGQLDLPQVDLMNFRVEFVRPRAKKSRAVDLRPAGTE